MEVTVIKHDPVKRTEIIDAGLFRGATIDCVFSKSDYPEVLDAICITLNNGRELMLARGTKGIKVIDMGDVNGI